jgi:hypothetical protein
MICLFLPLEVLLAWASDTALKSISRENIHRTFGKDK